MKKKQQLTFQQRAAAIGFAAGFGLIIGVALALIGFRGFAILAGFGMFLFSLEMMLNGTEE